MTPTAPKVYYKDDQSLIYLGDCLEVLRTFPDAKIDCVISSPPFEDRPIFSYDFGDHFVDILHELRRVIKKQGTIWINFNEVYSVGTAPEERDVVIHDVISAMIRAGSPTGGLILDPFFGYGATGMVAKMLGRKFIGIDISEDSIKVGLGKLLK
jgi:DNA modification methylase